MVNSHDATFEFINGQKEVDFNESINQLPYIFKDPHKLDKKIDPKKLQFGSKIDKDSYEEKNELYTVQEVLDPEKVKLTNGLIIRLLGVKENPKINGKAIEYLVNKTKGQRVFMKFDSLKYDKSNNLLCYLYLQNKTFINAHMIRDGFAFPDNEMEYKYKAKFSNLFQDIYEK